MTLAELYKFIGKPENFYVGYLSYGYRKFELNKDTRKLLSEEVYNIEAHDERIYVTLRSAPCIRSSTFRLSELLMNLKDDMLVTIYACTKVIYKDHTNEEIKIFEGKPCKVFRNIGKYRGLAALDPYVICVRTDDKTFISGLVYTVNRYRDE